MRVHRVPPPDWDGGAKAFVWPPQIERRVPLQIRGPTIDQKGFGHSSLQKMFLSGYLLLKECFWAGPLQLS